MKKLSIIIPCYNEEENINLIYKSILELKEDIDYNFEIIFINDGSKDKTFETIKNLNPTKKVIIKAINFSRNFGKEAAMYAGLETSTGDYTVIIDADMQQDPKLIKEMLQILETNSNYDSVCCFQEERDESKTIKFLKDKFSYIFNKISEVENVKGASDFRLVNRKVVDSILKLEESNRFSKGIFSWVGFNTYYLPYKALERKNGTTKWTILKLFKYAISGIISFSNVPLHLATILGLLLIIFSVFHSISIHIEEIFFKIPITGYSIIIGLLLLFGGIQLLSLGIIGEYLGRIYTETKKRPIYIAKEVYEKGSSNDK